MEIGIIGSGSLGLLYSYYLSKTNSVTLYTNRKQQADTINTKGITLIKDRSPSEVLVKAESSSDYKEQLLFVAVKQYNIEYIINELKDITSRTIIFLQNGMGHLPYLSELTQHHIVLGVSEHGALRLNDNTVEHTGIGMTKISFYKRDKYKNKYIQNLLLEENPLFSFKIKDDWKLMLMEKLVVNATINPLTAILKVKNGVLIENDHFFNMFYELFYEVIDVMELQNAELLWNHVQKICKKTALNESSMYKDIQMGKQTEIEAILGYLIQQATKKGKKIPLITFIYHAIKGIELNIGEVDG